MTDAGTSTRTPMSTGLMVVCSASRAASRASHADPSRPGARMTRGAPISLPSSRRTPRTAPSRVSTSATGAAHRIATRPPRNSRSLPTSASQPSVPRCRYRLGISFMSRRAASRCSRATASTSDPWSSTGAPNARYVASTSSTKAVSWAAVQYCPRNPPISVDSASLPSL